ncbi:DUF3014 domain-containing protein [Arenimonas metalli]|uniref:DUF3014 domain-containing protein n=1 Tax=Arenimonas metalli CF5-1 TaxID=1384056 RepID=A0A091BB59_9GAMM|nr:DUF3014 domain-containing protein [Arenimonas metalli]KFN48064.1 hypothetical protein N787_06400 [Arenimonas metalli CF5-1]
MSQRFHYGPWLAAAFVAATGLVAWKYYPRDAAPAPATATAPAAAVAPVLDPAPTAVPDAYPIDAVPVLPDAPATPLPPLDQSDAEAMAALAAAAGGADLGPFLRLQFLLPRLVATIDALPRSTVTQNVYAARPVAGTLGVATRDGGTWLDPANEARYRAAVALFEAVDSRQLVSAYVRFYPLLQQAYRDLGVPDRQFNDRLVEVIDHLLAAPTPPGPLALVPVPDKPRWAFADPTLEAASVGHKAMIRLGPEQAARVKAKLRELRTLLAGQRPAA